MFIIRNFFCMYLKKKLYTFYIFSSTQNQDHKHIYINWQRQ